MAAARRKPGIRTLALGGVAVLLVLFALLVLCH